MKVIYDIYHLQLSTAGYLKELYDIINTCSMTPCLCDLRIPISSVQLVMTSSCFNAVCLVYWEMSSCLYVLPEHFSWCVWRIRTSEGFHFAASGEGIVNMVIELPMKVNNSQHSGQLLKFSICTIWLVLFFSDFMIMDIYVRQCLLW